jgi:programmed cell death protein 4
MFQPLNITRLYLFKFLAFDVLLQNLPDLILDAPDAATILGNFIARAVADDCISAGFVHSRKDKMENENAK